MMEVKDLTARTRKGKLLLDHVSFALEPGGCTGLTGASGSGKTTLLKALLGVSDPDVAICGGQLLLDGKNLLQQAEKVRRELCGTTLGFIPQNPMTALNLHVSIGAQMTETFRKRLHIEKKAAQKLSMEALLQRVTMAILIGLSPRYIFADEPTSALDEENKSYLIQELVRMKQQSAILFVSHDDAAIRTLCDELLVMQSGTIAERGTTGSLFASPREEWTKEFVRLASTEEGGGWTWSKSPLPM